MYPELSICSWVSPINFHSSIQRKYRKKYTHKDVYYGNVYNSENIEVTLKILKTPVNGGDLEQHLDSDFK